MLFTAEMLFMQDYLRWSIATVSVWRESSGTVRLLLLLVRRMVLLVVRGTLLRSQGWVDKNKNYAHILLSNLDILSWVNSLSVSVSFHWDWLSKNVNRISLQYWFYLWGPVWRNGGALGRRCSRGVLLHWSDGAFLLLLLWRWRLVMVAGVAWQACLLNHFFLFSSCNYWFAWRANQRPLV